MKYLTTKQASEILNITQRRMQIKIKEGKFKDVKWCECGKSKMIPEKEVKK